LFVALKVVTMRKMRSDGKPRKKGAWETPGNGKKEKKGKKKAQTRKSHNWGNNRIGKRKEGKRMSRGLNRVAKKRNRA